jgi:ATP-dependent Clp protease protease subunit
MALSDLRVRVHEYEGRGVPALGYEDAETVEAVRDEQVDT